MNDDTEQRIYKERVLAAASKRRGAIWLRNLTSAVILCLVGLAGYGGFLFYRDRHPPNLDPIVVERTHTCPHSECKNDHKSLQRVDDIAPSVLAGVLLLYCAVVGVGSFVVGQQDD